MGTPWYATREDVKAALDSKETARNNSQIDRALAAATDTVDGAMHRRFYPTLATRYFPYPDEGWSARPWRLWLDDNELISLTTLSSGGTIISSSDYFLEPNTSGPPYNRIEIDLSSSAAFGGGGTWQRDIAGTGLFGYRNDEAAAGTLTAAASSTSTTTVDVSDSSAIGVGSLIRADSERLIVTAKSMLTTAQTLQTAVTASLADTTLAVTTGSSYAVDEVLLLDSERMLVVDVAGNNLTVKRAWDGSVLAAHTGSTIYALRRLTVERGALGTTAATHSNAAAVNRWTPPGLIRELCLAHALVDLLGANAGYGVANTRTQTSPGEAANRSLGDLADLAYARYGRKTRMRVV